MTGARSALLVVNARYDDPGLRQLRAPGADAAALAEVLADTSVGAFDVRVLTDETTQVVRTAIEEFFSDRMPDDLLLLHFSCHGVKGADGRLFLAQRDTRPKLLASTGVPAEFVNEQMAASRAQRIALFLDCCYGGAFPRGLVGRAGDDAQIGDNFRDVEDESSGRGRVVVTASSAMQYSFEGGSLSADEVQPSLFTGALVEALSTGEADRDGDGWVGLTELFTFVRNQVRRVAPDQTPQMWTYGASGEILLARSRVRRIVAGELDPEVAAALQSPLPSTRLGQVELLRDWVLGTDLPMALAAWQALDRLTRDDSAKVRSAVARVRAEGALSVAPQTLQVATGTAEAVLSLHGPPLARAITVSADSPALRMEYDDEHIRVATTESAGNGQHALLTVTSPTGSVDVTVVVTEAEDEESSTVAVDVSPAPTSTPVADETAVLTAIPDTVARLPHPVPRVRRRLPVLAVLSAVAVAAVGVLAWRLFDSPDQELPQGPRLDDDVLVWVAQTGSTYSLEWGAPGSGGEPLVPATDHALRYPAISPDRKTVVYMRMTEKHGELYVVASDGKDPRRLEVDSSCFGQGRPAWSPDSKRLATICYNKDGSHHGLALVSVDDGSVRFVNEDPYALTPDWSPTTDLLVFAEASATGDGSKLWTVRTDGSDLRQLTFEGYRDLSPAFDPTGQWVAFSRKDSTSGTTGIYKQELHAREAQQLTNPPESKDVDPAWSYKAQFVAFERGRSILRIPADKSEQARPFLEPPTDSTKLSMVAWQ